jgi:hypothetical protein
MAPHSPSGGASTKPRAVHFRLHFEAIARLDPDERQLLKRIIESVVLTHDVKRFGVAQPAMARTA